MDRDPREELQKAIDLFLANRRESDSGGYAPVLNRDIELLHHIIEKLVELKFQPDCDNDYPIEWDVIDRNTHHRSHFFPIPYYHQVRDLKGVEKAELQLEYHTAVMTNFNMAQSWLDQYMRGIQDALRDERKKHQKKEGPFLHEAPDKCPDCGHHTVVSAGPGGGQKCINDGCGYWFCY